MCSKLQTINFRERCDFSTTTTTIGSLRCVHARHTYMCTYTPTYSALRGTGSPTSRRRMLRCSGGGMWGEGRPEPADRIANPSFSSTPIRIAVSVGIDFKINNSWLTRSAQKFKCFTNNGDDRDEFFKCRRVRNKPHTKYVVMYTHTSQQRSCVIFVFFSIVCTPKSSVHRDWVFNA